MKNEQIILDEKLKAKMIRDALSVLPNSFAPYSHYNVAAAVLTSSGKIYTGVNVESALLSCTICAERNAIFTAVAEGEREILAVAVVGGLNASEPDQLVTMDYCTPCGVCRQVMRDWTKKPKEMMIICAKSPTDYIEKSLDELLPLSFGPEDLED